MNSRTRAVRYCHGNDEYRFRVERATTGEHKAHYLPMEGDPVLIGHVWAEGKRFAVRPPREPRLGVTGRTLSGACMKLLAYRQWRSDDGSGPGDAAVAARFAWVLFWA